VAWLFREDMKWRQLESKALWIAGIWVAIAASRSPTYWTSYLGLGGVAVNNVEGSPVNFLCSATLIVAACLVLRQRRLNWSAVVQGNKALFLMYFFFAISALWAEYPIVSLRRLFKDGGCVAIALLLLTQRDPGAAIRTVYARVSFILFPFSVLFYKYFPEIGRTYSKSGEPAFAGVCTFKNELGQTLMVFMLILLWDFLELWKEEKSARKKRQVRIQCGCLLMSAWLMFQAHSATSLVCLLLGLVAWWAGRYLARLRSHLQVVLSVLAVGLCVIVLQVSFQLSRIGLEALGRDPSLTGRADAWPVIIELCKNSLLGDGYCMFWDVSRAELAERLGGDYPSAHNGYLETYLSGGILGLGFLGLFLLASFLKTSKGLLAGGIFGRLGFIFWVVLVVYNWTESSFILGGALWFTFLLWAIKLPRGVSSAVVLSSLNCGPSGVLPEGANVARGS
jgi:O-antigen ligase